MAFDPTDYLPHGMVAALATVATWVFRDHVKQDERRFGSLSKSIDGLSTKLDTAIATQASNHAEILKLLLDATQRDHDRDIRDRK